MFHALEFNVFNLRLSYDEMFDKIRNIGTACNNRFTCFQCTFQQCHLHKITFLKFVKNQTSIRLSAYAISICLDSHRKISNSFRNCTITKAATISELKILLERSDCADCWHINVEERSARGAHKCRSDSRSGLARPCSASDQRNTLFMSAGACLYRCLISIFPFMS